MKKLLFIIALAALMIGCASYVIVTTQRPAQVQQMQDATRIGVVVLSKVGGNINLMIGDNDEPNKWSVPSYSELQSSAVIWVWDDYLTERYLSVGQINHLLAETAADVLGNGPAYEYSYVKGFSIRPNSVSNTADAGTDGAYIEGPEAIVVSHNLEYRAEDRELIPLAVTAGNTLGIDALIVLRVSLTAEGGQVGIVDDFGGSAIGSQDFFAQGDWFARTELYIDEMSIIDANTGEFIFEEYQEFSSLMSMQASTFSKLDGIRDENQLRNFFGDGRYAELLQRNTAGVFGPAVPYVRAHSWTTYEAE